MRVLLTIDAPRVNTQVIAASTAYTKRNAQKALTSLSAAGALSSFEVGNEQRFSAPRDRWAQFFELDELPLHEDWPQLFAAYRKIHRWLADPAHHELTEYMLSSEARTLAEDVRPDLQFAGIAIDSVSEDSPYLESFVDSCANADRFKLGPGAAGQVRGRVHPVSTRPCERAAWTPPPRTFRMPL